MESNGIRQARVKATGKMVQVYLHKHKTEVYVNADDCCTEYLKRELEFIS